MRAGGAGRGGVTETTYGPLKVAVELLAREIFGEPATVVRPTYVIGPVGLHAALLLVGGADGLRRRGARAGRPGRPDPGDRRPRPRGTSWSSWSSDDVAGTFHAVSPGAAVHASGRCSPTSPRWSAPRARRSPGSTSSGCSTRARATPASRCGAAATPGSSANAASPAAARAAGLHGALVRQSVVEIAEHLRRAPAHRRLAGLDRARERRAARGLARARAEPRRPHRGWVGGRRCG